MVTSAQGQTNEKKTSQTGYKEPKTHSTNTTILTQTHTPRGHYGLSLSPKLKGRNSRFNKGKIRTYKKRLVKFDPLIKGQLLVMHLKQGR